MLLLVLVLLFVVVLRVGMGCDGGSSGCPSTTHLIDFRRTVISIVLNLLLYHTKSKIAERQLPTTEKSTQFCDQHGRLVHFVHFVTGQAHPSKGECEIMARKIQLFGRVCNECKQLFHIMLGQEDFTTLHR